MAFFGRSLILALGAGVAGGAIASLLHQKEGSSRPFSKSAIRAGLLMFAQARQTVGELTEAASDLIAEAQAELEEERERGTRPAESGREQIVPFATRAASEAERKAHG